jgi:hypothetical protein
MAFLLPVLLSFLLAACSETSTISLVVSTGVEDWIEIDAEELGTKIAAGDDFILIVSSEICTSCSDFRPILLEYITTMGVVVYKIESDSAFPPGNSTLAYAYTPTVALFSAGELLVSVDPHERASAFSSYEGFVDWISRYVAYTATTTSLT